MIFFVLGLVVSAISVTLTILFHFPLLLIFALPPFFWATTMTKKNEDKKSENGSYLLSQFCSSCGYKFKGFERYCPICGTRREKKHSLHHNAK